MWKNQRIQAELGPIEEEKEALEEERVAAGKEPPVPMLCTKAKMVQLRKARIPRLNQPTLEDNPPKTPSR